MSKSSGLTRGDRRRNRRIGFVRQVVRPDLAILAIDLGEDKQVVRPASIVDRIRPALGFAVLTRRRTELTEASLLL